MNEKKENGLVEKIYVDKDGDVVFQLNKDIVEYINKIKKKIRNKKGGKSKKGLLLDVVV